MMARISPLGKTPTRMPLFLTETPPRIAADTINFGKVISLAS